MKFFKYLSAMAILNLVAVGVISSFSAQPALTAQAPRTPKPTPTPIIIVKTIVTKIFKTMAPNQTKAPPVAGQPQTATTPTPAPPPQIAQCVITIDGGNYDVTNFRFSHSGGNVFNCGTDVSSIFWGRHGQREFSILQQYRI